jgi:prepilin-type N-terminal cleavage/methylation domain-containing protein
MARRWNSVRSIQVSTNPKSKLHSQSGFSLVELLIASVVFLIMMGGILSVMRVSTALSHSTEQNLNLQENVRSAINIISSELLNAGSGLTFTTTTTGTPPVTISGLPPITVPNGAFVGPRGSALNPGTLYFITPCKNTGQTVTRDGEGNAIAAIQTDMLSFLGGMGQSAFVNQSAAGGPTANFGNTVYLENNSGFRQGQVMLFSNGAQVSLSLITGVLAGGGLQFNSGDPLGLNSAGSGGAPNPNQNAALQIQGMPPPIAYPLSSITYFIDSTSNPSRPMLRRVANSVGGATAGSVVADSIENLQVSYLVDSDANATTPNVAMNNPPPTGNQITLTRAVTVTITGRSQIKMGDTNFADRHSRLTMSQTIFFRNNVRR